MIFPPVWRLLTTIGTNPTLADIQSAFAAENVMWRLYAQERMSERAISRQDVKAIIQGGEIIESYDMVDIAQLSAQEIS